jgi:hypothetical protein
LCSLRILANERLNLQGMQAKICAKCRSEKDEELFDRMRGGRHPRCKSCRKEDRAAHRANHRDDINAKARERYAKDPSRWRERYRRQTERDPEALKERNRESAARHRASSTNTIKLRYMRARYGLTIEEYDAIVAAQDGLCRICRKTPNGRWKRLAVDHDHSTGRVRGLLCHACNAGLGHFRDSVESLRAAISYLES